MVTQDGQPKSESKLQKIGSHPQAWVNCCTQISQQMEHMISVEKKCYYKVSDQSSNPSYKHFQKFEPKIEPQIFLSKRRINVQLKKHFCFQDQI